MEGIHSLDGKLASPSGIDPSLIGQIPNDAADQRCTRGPIDPTFIEIGNLHRSDLCGKNPRWMLP